MGLFGGSKSSSNTSIVETTTTDQQTSTFGDLSSGNIALKDSVYNGFTSQDLTNVLNYNYGVLKDILDTVNANTSNTISSVQSTASKAIEETGKAYSGSLPTSTIIGELKPIIIIIGLTGLVVFFFKGRK